MPSAAEIRAAMNRYIELMCVGDADGIVELFSDDASVEDPVGGALLQGKETLRGFYAATSPNLQVELSGPICVAGNQCAMPMLAELSMNDQKHYIDVVDVMTFDDAGKVTSMRAFWNPAEMRSTR
jgi:steroid delta-isomerase